jgi:hypothetical protein
MQVTIAVLELEARVIHFIVPSISSYAYLLVLPLRFNIVFTSHTLATGEMQELF